MHSTFCGLRMIVLHAIDDSYRLRDHQRFLIADGLHARKCRTRRGRVPMRGDLAGPVHCARLWLTFVEISACRHPGLFGRRRPAKVVGLPRRAQNANVICNGQSKEGRRPNAVVGRDGDNTRCVKRTR